MSGVKWSSIECFYLIGLEAPQSVAREVQRLKVSARINKMTTAPLPPLLPLTASTEPPKVPVPGLLPLCGERLKTTDLLKLSNDKLWWIWPIDAGDWLLLIAKALRRTIDGSAPKMNPFPMCEGIPIAAGRGFVQSELSSGSRPGWRTLKLKCWRIEYLAERPWYNSCSWREVWHRRLKRAPSLSNNDNRNDLA
ncbi:MAG: hypothetical protein P1P77_07875 [Spirochaetaceae bacterium]|nr:hypothetical protein [Spirochaetaceae bacterium]